MLLPYSLVKVHLFVEGKVKAWRCPHPRQQKIKIQKQKLLIK